MSIVHPSSLNHLIYAHEQFYCESQKGQQKVPILIILMKTTVFATLGVTVYSMDISNKFGSTIQC